MPTFTPPGRVERLASRHGLFGRMTITRGVSLLKEQEGEVAPAYGMGTYGEGPYGTPTAGFIYRQVEDPAPEEIDAAVTAYLGGRRYVVDETEAALLTAAGYGEWVEGISSTYGSGAYGIGPYGGV